MKRLLAFLFLLPSLAWGQVQNLQIGANPVIGGTSGYGLTVGSNGRLGQSSGFPASSIAIGTPLTGGSSNCIVYDLSNALGCITSAINGVLVTNGSGVPSLSTTLPAVNASAATTTPTGATVTRSLANLFADAISVRNFAACDGSTDDAVGVQAALTYASANGKTLDFGNYSCVSSAQLTVSSHSVSMRANYGTGSIKFTGTSANSAGFSFSPRGYNAGVYDTVFIDGLTIYAGAAHNSADAAIKAVWQTRVANGNQMLGISNVRVLPDAFGTHSFATALYVDAAFNGVVEQLLCPRQFERHGHGDVRHAVDLDHASIGRT
jgi:hypothetical protein